jgi:hypothetical protein
MRALTIDQEAQDKVNRLVAFATQPKNFYRPFAGDPPPSPPGNDHRHTTLLDTFRCVFSISVDEAGKLYRHLSISIPGGKYPNPVAVEAIGAMFGFEGSLLDWQIYANRDERCVAVGQLYVEVEDFDHLTVGEAR